MISHLDTSEVVELLRWDMRAGLISNHEHVDAYRICVAHSWLHVDPTIICAHSNEYTLNSLIRFATFPMMERQACGSGRVGSQKLHKLTGLFGSGHGFCGLDRVGSGNLDPRSTLVWRAEAADSYLFTVITPLQTEIIMHYVIVIHSGLVQDC